MPTKRRGAKPSSKKSASRKRVSKGGETALQRAANEYMETLVKYDLFLGTDLHPGVTRLLENLHQLLAPEMASRREEMTGLFEKLMAEFKKAGGPQKVDILSC